jgi:hypothetical protein
VLNEIRRRSLSLACAVVVVAAAGAAQAGTLGFEVLVSTASGSLASDAGAGAGETLVGSFEMDGSSLVSLVLELPGGPLATTSLTSATGDLDSQLTLVADASLGSSNGVLSGVWQVAAPGGPVTSATSTVSFDFAETLAGDVTGDGAVGAADFVALSMAYGSASSVDLTGDGVVGASDVILIGKDFGRTAGTLAVTGAVTSVQPASRPIPEPSSAALYALGGLLVTSVGRRRRPSPRV